MKIIELHMRITKKNENHKSPREKNGNHENIEIRRENYGTHENNYNFI